MRNSMATLTVNLVNVMQRVLLALHVKMASVLVSQTSLVTNVTKLSQDTMTSQTQKNVSVVKKALLMSLAITLAVNVLAKNLSLETNVQNVQLSTMDFQAAKPVYVIQKDLRTIFAT